MHTLVSVLWCSLCFQRYPFKNIFIYNRLLCCNQTCYCVGVVSVTPTSCYVTSAPRYQRRSSMYIRGLIPRNSTELVEPVPIATVPCLDFHISLTDCFSLIELIQFCVLFFSSVFWFRFLMTSYSRTMVWPDTYIEIPSGLGCLIF